MRVKPVVNSFYLDNVPFKEWKSTSKQFHLSTVTLPGENQSLQKITSWFGSDDAIKGVSFLKHNYDDITSSHLLI